MRNLKASTLKIFCRATVGEKISYRVKKHVRVIFYRLSLVVGRENGEFFEADAAARLYELVARVF